MTTHQQALKRISDIRELVKKIERGEPGSVHEAKLLLIKRFSSMPDNLKIVMGEVFALFISQLLSRRAEQN